MRLPNGIYVNCEMCERYWHGALVYWKDLSEITTDDDLIKLYCPNCIGESNVRKDDEED